MVPSFFEGPEKKVELVVRPQFPSLRELPVEQWRKVVQAARAQILSTRSSEAFDAYLLSESSLFVYDDRLLMLTCGRTTLADAVEVLMEMVPRESVALLVYERKNEHCPELQLSTFTDDATRIHRMIPGRAFRFGARHDHCVHMFFSSTDYVPHAQDTTLEVLMHDMHPEVSSLFTRSQAPENGSFAKWVGIENILPGFEIDEYIFQPAGYSLNALKGRYYYTIHVTPELEGSYVSFETNVDYRSEKEALVQRVLNVFRPSSYDVVAFDPEQTASNNDHKEGYPGYVMRDCVAQKVAGYQVSYQQFYRPCERFGRVHELVLGS